MPLRARDTAKKLCDASCVPLIIPVKRTLSSIGRALSMGDGEDEVLNWVPDHSGAKRSRVSRSGSSPAGCRSSEEHAFAGQGHAEVLVGQAGGHPAPRGAIKEAPLHEEGLVDLFERVLFLGQRGGQGVEAD